MKYKFDRVDLIFILLGIIMVINMTGCSKQECTPQNITVYKQVNHTDYVINNITREIVTLKYVNVSVPVIIEHNLTDKRCNQNYVQCVYDKNKYFDYYQNCLRENNSNQIANLSEQLRNTTWWLNKKDAQLRNISKFI
jgi:hypothetical protein